MNDEVEKTQEDEDIEKKVNKVLEGIRRQNLLLGARAICVNLTNMIDKELNKPGKRTMNDMKRIIKKVRDFCQTAVDHPVETPKFGEENVNEQS